MVQSDTRTSARRDNPRDIELSYHTIGNPADTAKTARFDDTLSGRAEMQAFLRSAVYSSGRTSEGVPAGITVKPKSMSPTARAAAENSLRSIHFGYLSRDEFKRELWLEVQQRTPNASRMTFDIGDIHFEEKYRAACNAKARKELEEIKQLIEKGAKPPVIKLGVILDQEIISELGDYIKDPTLKSMGAALDVRIVGRNPAHKQAILDQFGARFATKDTEEQRLEAYRANVKAQNEQRFEREHQEKKKLWNPFTWLRSYKLPWNSKKLLEKPPSDVKTFPLLERYLSKISGRLAAIREQPSVRSIQFGTLPELLGSLVELHNLSKQEAYKDLQIQLDPSVLVFKRYGISIQAGKTYRVAELGEVIEQLRTKGAIPKEGLTEYRTLHAQQSTRWRGQPRPTSEAATAPSSQSGWFNRWVARNFPRFASGDSAGSSDN